eukprot:gnl/TRDRNA2_/TRDRNA2_153561_c0_seq1.p1 gnl/TRDRNA2_/TRDRNA2_153561_c0~~gnl/TRDRNA2_/TRDRNA2_153561_c0_seq1.p1  ORF type:complete len:445 (-),score=82.70 gnl/TRDRNA2_/TRDRNA2_153561_c0_seq1:27-1361(-)
MLAVTDPGPKKTTPEEFQWERGPEIERRLREIRVQAVVFPPRDRIIEHAAWGMRRLIAVDVHSGEEVEVLEIPWAMEPDHTHKAVELCNRIEALKQLALSQYFRDYLGYDFSSYAGVGLHFMPSLKRGFCLRELVAVSGPILPSNPLFKFWSREILLALRDYLYQCCQELTEDITLAHIFVYQEGLQVLIRNAPFGERRGTLYEDVPEFGPRNKWRNVFPAVEARLLTMYGNMLVEMLYGAQRPDSPIRTLHELSSPLRNLIYGALNARDSLDHFMLLPSAARPPGVADAEDTGYVPNVCGLAGGLTGAGVDAYNAGDEYKLWWVHQKPHPYQIMPNPQRSMDAESAEFQEEWRLFNAEYHKGQVEDTGGASSGGASSGAEDLSWEPNLEALTIQLLLDQPCLRSKVTDSFEAIMSSFDTYSQRYEDHKAEKARLAKLLNPTQS